MKCKYCSNEFSQLRSTAKYCSVKCRVYDKRHIRPVTLIQENVTLTPKTVTLKDKDVTVKEWERVLPKTFCDFCKRPSGGEYEITLVDWDKGEIKKVCNLCYLHLNKAKREGAEIKKL